MTDWKAIAQARAPQLNEGGVEALAEILARLEVVIRPHLERIPHTTEPAIVFRCTQEDF